VCCHSNETRAPIGNLRHSAQLEGTPYHSPESHPGRCSSVGMRKRQTDTQTAVADIHFASAMPHMKCNSELFIEHLMHTECASSERRESLKVASES